MKRDRAKAAEVDFASLGEEQRQPMSDHQREKRARRYEQQLRDLLSEMERIQPNMKARPAPPHPSPPHRTPPYPTPS